MLNNFCKCKQNLFKSMFNFQKQIFVLTGICGRDVGRVVGGARLLVVVGARLVTTDTAPVSSKPNRLATPAATGTLLVSPDEMVF
jgi:hypothetical protein